MSVGMEGKKQAKGLICARSWKRGLDMPRKLEKGGAQDRELRIIEGKGQNWGSSRKRFSHKKNFLRHSKTNGEIFTSEKEKESGGGETGKQLVGGMSK